MGVHCRIIDKSRSGDINLKNEEFEIFGRLLPRFDGKSWSFGEEIFEKTEKMCFPEENYDFDEMSDNTVFVGAYDGESGDRCVGLAILQSEWTKYLYLYDLKVCSDCRGQGIGQLLIEKSCEIAKERGCIGIHTVGQDNNLAACRFYLKNGFEIGGLDTRTYRGTSQEGKADVHFYRDF